MMIYDAYGNEILTEIKEKIIQASRRIGKSVVRDALEVDTAVLRGRLLDHHGRPVDRGQVTRVKYRCPLSFNQIMNE